MKIYPAFLLFLLVISQSCSLKKYYTAQGMEIESDVANKINELDMKIFACLKGGQYSELYSMCTPELAEQLRKDTSGMIANLCRGLQGRGYRVYDEFYVRSLLPNTAINVSSSKDGANYTLSFVCPQTKADVSILAIGDTAQEYLLTMLYVDNGEWQLSDICIGPYAYGEQNAPKLYERAKLLYNDGDTLDAMLYMSLAEKCLAPVDENFKYEMAPEIENFNRKLARQTKKAYIFPITIANVPTKPEIFGITLNITQGELYPQVNYMTHIPIKDTAAVSRELTSIKQATAGLLGKLRSNNKYLFYRAFERIPYGKEEVWSYGAVETCDSKAPVL